MNSIKRTKFIIILLFMVFISVKTYSATLDDVMRKLGNKKADKQEGNEKIVILDKQEVEKLDISNNGKIFLEICGPEVKQAKVNNFIYHFKNMLTMKRLAKEVEKIEKRIYEDLPSDEKKPKKNQKPIMIYLMDSPNNFYKFIKKANPGLIIIREGFGSNEDIFLYVKWNNLANRSHSMRLIAHELSHIILRRLYKNKMPLWFDEGFAQFEEAKVSEYIKKVRFPRVEYIYERDLISLDRLVSLTNRPSGRKGDAFDYQAGQLISFLYDKHGRNKFQEFVKIIYNGVPFQIAIMKIYNYKDKDYKNFKRKVASYRYMYR